MYRIDVYVVLIAVGRVQHQAHVRARSMALVQLPAFREAVALDALHCCVGVVVSPQYCLSVPWGRSADELDVTS